VGRWCSHSVGAGRLEAKEERRNNQHEVEGVEGRQRGERYKGWKWGGGCYGSAVA
jgi:hypothetical protein